jgi:hypothetical protein
MSARDRDVEKGLEKDCELQDLRSLRGVVDAHAEYQDGFGLLEFCLPSRWLPANCNGANKRFHFSSPLRLRSSVKKGGG